MSNKNWNVRPFQTHVLAIFKEFKRICDTHSLRYYGAWGTALGAVRHGGFIPWDDDLDVLMPREDFSKFVKIVNDELKSNLRFIRGGETEAAPINFAKIYDITPGIVEDLKRETNIDFGGCPYIDIFILDGCPSTRVGRKLWWLMLKFLRMCQLYRFPHTGVVTPKIGSVNFHFARVIGALVSLFCPRTRTNEDFMCLVDRFFLKWPCETSSGSTEVSFLFGRKEMFLPFSYYEPAREIEFEGTRMYVPARVEDWLSFYFGDFMKYPPEQCRVPKHLTSKDCMFWRQ